MLLLFVFVVFLHIFRSNGEGDDGGGGWTVIVRGGVDGVEGGGLLLSVGGGWKWTVTVGGVLWVDCQGGGGVGL